MGSGLRAAPFFFLFLPLPIDGSAQCSYNEINWEFMFFWGRNDGRQKV